MDGKADVAGSVYAYWTWSAPAHTTLVAASLRYDVGQYAAPGDYAGAAPGWWAYRDAPAYDAEHVLDTCITAFGCTYRDGTLEWTGTATAIGVGAGCAGATNGYCAGWGDARQTTNVGWALLTLRDDASPQVGAVTGSALDGRPLAGGESLAWSASDVGGGIYQSEVRLDGTVVAARSTVDDNGGRCRVIWGGEFAYPTPCKTSASQSLTLDTTKVADGDHTLSATVWDAAGNASTIVSRRVTIDNVPPPAVRSSSEADRPRVNGDAQVGSELSAFDGNWSGSGLVIGRVWQVSDTADGPWSALPSATGSTLRPEAALAHKFVRLAVTASSAQGSATAYSEPRRIETPTSAGELKVLTANNGSGGDPASGRLVAKKKRTTVRTKFKGRIRMNGTLVDAAGRGIAGGAIDVLETVAGGARRQIATITTDEQGRYSWVPTTRSNRVIDLAYARQRGSTTYQSTQSLTVSVRARVSAKLTRRRIASRGKATVKGRVYADGLSKGLVVVIEARDRGRWLQAGTVRASSKGRFAWSHRYRISHGTIKFRARVLADDARLPARAGSSKTFKLRVG